MILILSKTKLTNNPGLMLILRLECMTLLQNQDFLLIISVGRGGEGMGFEPRFSSLGELSNGTELQGSRHCEI